MASQSTGHAARRGAAREHRRADHHPARTQVMTRIRVKPVRGALSGSVPLPSDKSIGHRAFIFSAFARGKCRVKSFSYGEDNVATMRAFASMGVQVEDDGQGTVIVQGQGLESLKA